MSDIREALADRICNFMGFAPGQIDHKEAKEWLLARISEHDAALSLLPSAPECPECHGSGLVAANKEGDIMRCQKCKGEKPPQPLPTAAPEEHGDDCDCDSCRDIAGFDVAAFMGQGKPAPEAEPREYPGRDLSYDLDEAANYDKAPEGAREERKCEACKYAEGWYCNRPGNDCNDKTHAHFVAAHPAPAPSEEDARGRSLEDLIRMLYEFYQRATRVTGLGQEYRDSALSMVASLRDQLAKAKADIQRLGRELSEMAVGEGEAISRAEAAESQLAASEERMRGMREAPLADFLSRQIEWSSRTFGSGRRTLGILKHIGKEIAEVQEKPEDLTEWIDIIILAIDGYWRHGGRPETLCSDLTAKAEINYKRVYPMPTSEDEPSEHVRATLAQGKPQDGEVVG